MDSREDIWMVRQVQTIKKNYEGLTESSQALIYAAMIHIMIRRMAKVQTFMRMGMNFKTRS
jgi:putative transposase